MRCYIQAYLSQFFNLASFLWTAVIAYALHRTVVLHREATVHLHKRFDAYVWLLSFYVVALTWVASVPPAAHNYQRERLVVLS